MILTNAETQITSQILKRVFNADIAPDQIKDIQVHHVDEGIQTVVVVTSSALYSLGKDYFRELVGEFKPVAKLEPKKAVRQLQDVTLLNSNGANFIYQVIGETGNLYLVNYNSSTGYARCGCKSASFGRGCYHASSVKEFAAASTWQTVNNELLTHIEEQAEVVAPKPKCQGYCAPIERGVPSMKGGVSRLRGRGVREMRSRALFA